LSEFFVAKEINYDLTIKYLLPISKGKKSSIGQSPQSFRGSILWNTPQTAYNWFKYSRAQSSSAEEGVRGRIPLCYHSKCAQPPCSLDFFEVKACCGGNFSSEEKCFTKHL